MDTHVEPKSIPEGRNSPVAEESGSINGPTMDFIRSSKMPNQGFTWAAKNGYLDVVKRLHDNRSEGCTKDAMDGAARNEHLEIVEWLHDNRSEGCTKDAMDEAALKGHREVLKWLHDNRPVGSKKYAQKLISTS